MGKTGLKEKQEASTATMVRLGYLVPSNEEEFDLFEEQYASYDFKLSNLVLDPHELILSQSNECIPINTETAPTIKNLFFKRVVLAAEIVSQLHEEPTFGHVKFQKLVFLCEQAASIKLDHLYQKQAAGPYDRKFMHSIDLQLEKQKWFKVEQEYKSGFNRFKYSPLEHSEKYKQYYSKYYPGSDDKIQWIINEFRTKKTDQVELIATLFASWLEIINGNEIFSEDLLISRFYNWSKEKAKFTITQVNSGIQWMKSQDFIPNPSC
jgi:hypothetical protein